MSVHATLAVLWLHIDRLAAMKSENVTCTVKTIETIRLRCCSDVQTVHTCEWHVNHFVLFVLFHLLFMLQHYSVSSVSVTRAFHCSTCLLKTCVDHLKTCTKDSHTCVFTVVPSYSICIWSWEIVSLFGRSSRIPAGVGSLLALLLGNI